MTSGSVNFNNDNLEKLERVINYQIFKKSLINIMEDAGFDMDLIHSSDIDNIVFILLRSVLGEEKLYKYMNNLKTNKMDLN